MQVRSTFPNPITVNVEKWNKAILAIWSQDIYPLNHAPIRQGTPEKRELISE
jgi:hypothetical protein